MKPNIVVVREPWRPDPLAWIHRAEARAVARELDAPLVDHRGELPTDRRPLLRLSDPVLRRVVAEARTPYFGPGHEALERCYDKLEAAAIVAGSGIDTPATVLADAPSLLQPPFVLKPRRGSDSIGVRIASAVPQHMRDTNHLVQKRIFGREMTIALFRGEAGMPIEILLPRGTPYSFIRKYALRPRRVVRSDESLRAIARRIAELLRIDWAARIDLIVDETTQRPFFLECDAAPLVGPDSAFAASFDAAGVSRQRQLDWLVS